MLDAGTWFNETSIEQARPSFASQHQYISTLEDLVAYSKGKMLERDAQGKRVFTMGQKTGEKIKSLSGTADVIKYTFGYGGHGKPPGNLYRVQGAVAESCRVRGDCLQGTGSFGHEYYHATGTGEQPLLREWQGEYREHEW